MIIINLPGDERYVHLNFGPMDPEVLFRLKTNRKCFNQGCGVDRKCLQLQKFNYFDSNPDSGLAIGLN